jgi:hypothetical protein
MREINSTNIVPFFNKREHAGGLQDVCHCCQGVIAPTTGFVPFQLITDINVANSYFEIYDKAGNLTLGVNDANIEKTPLNGATKYAYTYKGTGVNLPCGLYQLRLRGTDIWSEFINVTDSFDAYLEFYSFNDLGGVLYQTGFKQRLYFKKYEDYPITDLVEEKTANTEGREIVTFSSQVNKRKLSFLGLFASQHSAFKRIAQHQFTTLTETDNGVISTIAGGSKFFDTEIEPLPCLSKASIIFETSTVIKTFCEPNEFVI